MCRIYLVFYIILTFAFGYWASDSFKQERAKLKYYNSKYITDVVVFTGRRSRREPYLTNMTGTTLVPYGNNVSAAVTLTLQSGGDFRFVAKACDSFRNKWMSTFMKSFSNLNFENCPFQPGHYAFLNMELPPKNIPLPVADGDYVIKYELFVTATKEQIIEIVSILHFDQNARRAKGKKGK